LKSRFLSLSFLLTFIGITLLIPLTTITTTTPEAEASSHKVRTLYYWASARCSTGATGCNTLLDATLDAERGGASQLVFHFGPGQVPNFPNTLQINTMKAAIDSRQFRCHEVGMQGVSLAQLEVLADVVKAEFKDGYNCTTGTAIGPLLGYNLESGLSPAAEVADPVASYEEAKDIAVAHGLRLLATPARGMLTNNADAIAIAGDSVLMDIQEAAVQTSGTCSNLVTHLDGRVDTIRERYPNKAIVFQISLTQPDATVSMMEDCMDAAYAGTTASGAVVWWGSSHVEIGVEQDEWEQAMTYWENNFPNA
jgi:hypothetical protein